MKKILLLFALALLGMVAAQAENYGINVAGVEVSSSNYNNVTGGDIKSGTVKYSPSSKTLTLTNVRITRTGGSNYAVHNRSVSGLTIKFVGANVCNTVGAGLKLMENTDIIIDGGTSYASFTVTGTSDGQNGMNISSNKKVSISGTGSIYFYAYGNNGSNSKEGILGGNTSTILNLMSSVTMTVKSYSSYGLSTLKVNQYNGSKLIVEANGSKQSLYSCYWSATSNAAVLAPVGAYYYNGTIYSSSDTPVKSDDIQIHSDYVAIINSNYFPDANFRNYLKSLYSKGYINSSDVNARTSLNVSSKNISNLTGLNYFSNLTSLYCQSNSLSSLPTLPSTLKEINCSSNQLTSLPTLPSSLTYLNSSYNRLASLPTLPYSIQQLYCGNNTFNSLSISDYRSLKTLDVSNCASLSTLTCNGTALTSLNISGCNQLASLYCINNQLTSLSITSSSIQTIYCGGNKFTSLTITGKGSLQTLDVSNNTSLTSLDCHNNSLNTLKTDGCTAMTSLDCSSNYLNLLPTLPSTLQTLYCGGNKFTSLTITGRSNLKNLNVSGNSKLTSLDCRNNALTTLNVANCSAMTTLNCSSNQLTSLGSTLPANLTSFDCSNNQLSSLPTLPVSLQTIYCGGNRLSSLNVNNYSSLKTLSVYSSGNLTSLSCSNCALTTLNASGCSALATINCSKNKFTSLTLSGLRALKTLDVSENSNLTSLDCSGDALTSLNLNSCTALQTLNVSNNTSLTSLACGGCALTSLNVSGCNAMKYLACNNNRLSTLGTLPSALESLDCSHNQVASLGTLPSTLKSLDCGYNNIYRMPTIPSAIEVIKANNNQFTSFEVMDHSALKTLDVHGNSVLTDLECKNNALTNLNFSDCPSLEMIHCSNNKLTSLDVSSYTNLINLECQYNELSSIEVAGLSNLITFHCNNNKLTSLSVQGCNSLGWFYISNNQINGDAMTALVNSMPTVTKYSQGTFRVYNEDDDTEQNAITADQFTILRDKNWLPYKFANNDWVVIEAPEPPQPTYKVGDVDGNGEVNGNDLNTLINVLLGKDDADNYDGRANVDGEGGIDGNDLNLLINILLGKVVIPEPDPFVEQTFTVKDVSFKMKPVEGGTFTMGATPSDEDAEPSEFPQHEVTLSNYYIGETEVTQELWYAVMGTNPSSFNTGNRKRPVEQVTWYDCQTFIANLNQLTGQTFRLPTEAEWEYAARGGNLGHGYKYSGSNTLGNVAWYYDNLPSNSSGTEGYGTQTVATKAANELGLYDMSGNVYEWCQDWFGNYSSEAQNNPTGPASGSYRVTRGGCWDAEPWLCRVWFRNYIVVPSSKSSYLGLRLAM